jgi:integral membrane sensor domain MASE1
MAQIGVPLGTEGVIEMLPTVLLPFNFSKAMLNSAIAMMIYKPLSIALRRIGIADGDSKSMTFNRGTVTILVVGGILLTASVILLSIIPYLAG